MIRKLIFNNKTHPFIINYYNKCLYTSTANPNNNNNNNNNNKNNNNKNIINDTNNNENDKQQLITPSIPINNESLKSSSSDQVKPRGTNLNLVKKEIIDMFEEDLFESEILKQYILQASEFRAKKEIQWCENVLNFSPYLRMVGLDGSKIKSKLVNILIHKPQQYYYNYLLECDKEWIDPLLIDYQVQQVLHQYFNNLNDRDQSSLKEITSTWLYKMVSPLTLNLSHYDTLGTNFNFKINSILSTQRGYIQRSADKLYITFHFNLIGELGVNEYKTDISNNFKCSVIFESIIPYETKRSSDFRWKMNFIGPTSFQVISVESLVPMLK